MSKLGSITIHDGVASINVKVHHLEALLPDAYTEEETVEAYEATHSWFWWRAGELAKGHGYTGVYATGRTGGWLVPYHGQGRVMDSWDVLHESEGIVPFLSLQSAIHELLVEVPSRYTAYMEDIIEERKERERNEQAGFVVGLDMWYL